MSARRQEVGRRPGGANRRPSGGRRSAAEDDRGPIKASTAGALLKALHIMNADGSISADMRRKFKQVNHLVELFLPVIEETGRRARRLVIVDANCGNSYLGFLLYHFATVEMGYEVRVHGIDRHPARVETCRERAAVLGFGGMTFEAGAVGAATLPEAADLLVSLHGCDTATDEALVCGVKFQIPQLHVVPCCQQEVRRLLRPSGFGAPFLAAGIVAEDYAALVTDVIRGLWLRTRGYRTEIIEFVPLEHSMKNRLLRAKFTRRRDAEAAEQLEALLAGCSRPPAIVREGAGLPPWWP